MTNIDYYFSTVSPYTYLAGTRLEQIAQMRGASITYKPLDIVALSARTGGIHPKERHPNRKDCRLQEAPPVGKAGMPLNWSTQTCLGAETYEHNLDRYLESKG